LLTVRLALESPAPRDLGSSGPLNIRASADCYADISGAPPGSLLLDADPLTAGKLKLAEALAKMVIAHPDLRLSPARHVPAFRPAVSVHLIAEVSKENARIALVSALPAIVPFTPFLSPATALGDMVLRECLN